MTKASKLAQIFSIFEEEMTPFWLTLRNFWTHHRPKNTYHQMMMNYSPLESMSQKMNGSSTKSI